MHARCEQGAPPAGKGRALRGSFKEAKELGGGGCFERGGGRRACIALPLFPGSRALALAASASWSLWSGPREMEAVGRAMDSGLATLVLLRRRKEASVSLARLSTH